MRDTTAVVDPKNWSKGSAACQLAPFTCLAEIKLPRKIMVTLSP